jgi:hypothetical protein
MHNSIYSKDIIKQIDDLTGSLDDLNDELGEREAELEALNDEIEGLDMELEESDSCDEDITGVLEQIKAKTMERTQLLERINNHFLPEIEDIEKELRPLLDLQQDAELYCDWRSGTMLIHENDFPRYAEQYAEDLGLDLSTWPYTCIDWEKAANDLVVEFTPVEYEGDTYYVQ